jgi:hypothetical protein
VKKFYEAILDKNLSTSSLSLSNPAMEYKQSLNASAYTSKDQINEGFRLPERTNNFLENIKKNQKTIIKNKNFNFKIK